MSYTLSRPSSTQRSSLLLIVVGLHVGLFLLVMAAKTIAPQIMEMPLIVDLLPAPQLEEPPQAKPLPVAKPEPVRKPQPTPKVPTPVLETTSSEVPAPAAPTAPPVEAPAPPAAPAVSQARFDADYLRNPPPPYPPLSRRMGEEGKVILRVPSIRKAPPMRRNPHFLRQRPPRRLRPENRAQLAFHSGQARRCRRAELGSGPHHFQTGAITCRKQHKKTSSGSPICGPRAIPFPTRWPL
jgi:periplasmic protein TonB